MGCKGNDDETQVCIIWEPKWVSWRVIRWKRTFQINEKEKYLHILRLWSLWSKSKRKQKARVGYTKQGLSFIHRHNFVGSLLLRAGFL